ncbi:hypothetical protein, partial [uncultured Faecalibacterium sp.]|uniref:hypothetical protein n=1 Tax=uncultured Faecalibacterium sp. TaxID=259315 RepID=UPI002632AB1C
CHNGSSVLTIKNRSLIFDTSRATGKLRRNRLKREILSNLIIAYLLEEQNTLCTPPVGGKSQSSENSSSTNSASVSSFSFSMTCFVDKPQPGAGVVEHGDNAQSSRCRHGLHCLHGLDLVYAEKGPLAAADPRSRRM